jgi:NAD(P)-dependent dehydrogenase (short-subunit alcohol dehydrogenase family)
MLLDDKVGVIYGAGGGIGGAVARAFAREGARLFLTGRRLAPVELVADEIDAGRGCVEAAEVDALDERAVDGHLQHVMDIVGRVDISFNAIGIPNADILGVPLIDLDLERFLEPLASHTTSYFLTARLAARRMVASGSGVIMTVSALHHAPDSRWSAATVRHRRRRKRSRGTSPPSSRRTGSAWSASDRRECPRRERSGTPTNLAPPHPR